MWKGGGCGGVWVGWASVCCGGMGWGAVFFFQFLFVEHFVLHFYMGNAIHFCNYINKNVVKYKKVEFS